MRNLTILLFLIFIGCKNGTKSDGKKITESETKTENGIEQSVSEMWTDYTESNSQLKNSEIPENEYFHDNEKDADRLAELTLNDKKKASSGLYSLYKHYQVDLPKVGKKLIITDFDGNAKAIIETTSVDTIPFKKISEDYAELDMGTNIEPLEKWKKAHWEFFAGAMEEIGEKPTEEMLVVCEKFKRIWPEKY